jgi:hypothetical protein
VQPLVADLASDILLFREVVKPTILPGDLTTPGDQIPLFIGPCFHCGEGLVPKLPNTCPVCGHYLTRIVPSEMVDAGPRMKRLWLWLTRWQDVLEKSLTFARNLR